MKRYSKNQSFLGMVIVLFVITTFGDTQVPDTIWTRTYGGTGDDYAESVRQTSDGGYIIVGGTQSFGAGDWDVWLVKTDSLGDALWTKTIGGTAEDIGRSVEQTTDGGYIITGWTYSYSVGWEDLYLIKTNANGDTVWTRSYGGTAGDIGDFAQPTSDGGYIVTGVTESFGPGITDVWLLKSDSLGDTLWTRTYGGTYPDGGRCVQQTSDSGYIVAGDTKSFGVGNWDFYLIKTDTTGNAVWTRTYGGGAGDASLFVEQTSDGGYIVSGWSCSFTGYYDAYIVKTNEQGYSSWSGVYGGASQDESQCIRQTLDGRYISVGGTRSFGAGNWDVYLVKIEEGGSIVWSQTYGGTADDRGFSIQQTTDGGYITAGYTESFGAGGRDVYLIRIGPDVGIQEHKPSKNIFTNLQVSPNPFRNRTQIRYTIQDTGYMIDDITVRIYDAKGQLVKSFPVPSSYSQVPSVISWDGVDDANRKLPSGVYFLKLLAGDYIATEKLLLIR